MLCGHPVSPYSPNPPTLAGGSATLRVRYPDGRGTSAHQPANGGCWFAVGGTEIQLQALYSKGLRVLGYAGLLEPDEAMTSAIAKALRALADGELSVPVDSIVPLDQVSSAFESIGDRRVLGKLVLDTGGG